MIRVPIACLRDQVGETVTIPGWAATLRLQRAMQFVVLRDHTGSVQLTHRRDGTPLEAELEALTAETAVRVTGRVEFRPRPNSPGTFSTVLIVNRQANIVKLLGAPDGDPYIR